MRYLVYIRYLWCTLIWTFITRPLVHITAVKIAFGQAFVGRDAITWKYIRIILTFRAKALRLELTALAINLRSKRRNSPYIFSGSFIPTNESLFIWLALPTVAKTVLNSLSLPGSALTYNWHTYIFYWQRLFSDNTQIKNYVPKLWQS
jgi:hypothetical protein